MHPVIDTFMRAMPHALREQDRPEGTTVRFTVSGAAGGQWDLVRSGGQCWLVHSTQPKPIKPNWN